MAKAPPQSLVTEVLICGIPSTAQVPPGDFFLIHPILEARPSHNSSHGVHLRAFHCLGYSMGARSSNCCYKYGSPQEFLAGLFLLFVLPTLSSVGLEKFRLRTPQYDRGDGRRYLILPNELSVRHLSAWVRAMATREDNNIFTCVYRL